MRRTECGGKQSSESGQACLAARER